MPFVCINILVVSGNTLLVSVNTLVVSVNTLVLKTVKVVNNTNEHSHCIKGRLINVIGRRAGIRMRSILPKVGFSTIISPRHDCIAPAKRTATLSCNTVKAEKIRKICLQHRNIAISAVIEETLSIHDRHVSINKLLVNTNNVYVNANDVYVCTNDVFVYAIAVLVNVIKESVSANDRLVCINKRLLNANERLFVTKERLSGLTKALLSAKGMILATNAPPLPSAKGVVLEKGAMNSIPEDERMNPECV
jgi:hypothetical protein